MSHSQSQYSMSFAITLTLNPKLFHHDCVTQHNLFMQELCKLCEACAWRVSLVLELTKSFNCHYHGFIQIPIDKKSKKSIQHRITDILRTNKIIGYTYIKDIDNDQIWLEYTTKEITTTFKETGIYPVCKDDIDLYEISSTFDIFQA